MSTLTCLLCFVTFPDACHVSELTLLLDILSINTIIFLSFGF